MDLNDASTGGAAAAPAALPGRLRAAVVPAGGRDAAPHALSIDPDAAWRALLVRDPAADGRFYVGVASTGVYCRPVCRVRMPQRRNCRFFASAAQAEAAAFRPCLKCRPEIAPGPGLPWSTMDAARTLALQAAAWLDAHAHDGIGAGDGRAATAAALAAHLGIGERHLRRIFAATHGVSPLQYLQTRRLLLAKQLLTDSALPVAQVALASGFASVRRFNAAFAARYRMNPTRLRREARPGAAIPAAVPGHAAPRHPALATSGARRAPQSSRRDGPHRDSRPDADAVAATLAFREPFDRAALLDFLARHAIGGVEHADGRALRRTLRPGLYGAAGGWIEATFDERRPLLRVRYATALAPASGALLRAVRRWLDLDADPCAIAARLTPLAAPAGLRLPGSLDAFELAVRAVLGQQVTVAAACTLARRLVAHFGAPAATPWHGIDRTFPSPEAIVAASADGLGRLGVLRSRSAAIVALAQEWDAIAPLLAPGAAPAPLVARLAALPGIGAWTAHYIAMRALGWSDAFPPGDVAVLAALGPERGAAARRSAEERAEAWRPWRSYAVMALWTIGGAPVAGASGAMLADVPAAPHTAPLRRDTPTVDRMETPS